MNPKIKNYTEYHKFRHNLRKELKYFKSMIEFHTNIRYFVLPDVGGLFGYLNQSIQFGSLDTIVNTISYLIFFRKEFGVFKPNWKDYDELCKKNFPNWKKLKCSEFYLDNIEFMCDIGCSSGSTQIKEDYDNWCENDGK